MFTENPQTYLQQPNQDSAEIEQLILTLVNKPD